MNRLWNREQSLTWVLFCFLEIGQLLCSWAAATRRSKAPFEQRDPTLEKAERRWRACCRLREMKRGRRSSRSGVDLLSDITWSEAKVTSKSSNKTGSQKKGIVLSGSVLRRQTYQKDLPASKKLTIYMTPWKNLRSSPTSWLKKRCDWYPAALRTTATGSRSIACRAEKRCFLSLNADSVSKIELSPECYGTRK